MRNVISILMTMLLNKDRKRSSQQIVFLYIFRFDIFFGHQKTKYIYCHKMGLDEIDSTCVKDPKNDLTLLGLSIKSVSCAKYSNSPLD